VPTYGVFSALGMVAALLMVLQTAKRLDLPKEKLWNLTILALLTALLASKLLMVATHLWLFRAHPFWVLGLTPRYNPWIPGASAAIGVAGGWLYLMAEGLPLRRTLDALAPAAALGLGLRAVGAFVAGAQFGTPTRMAWAVSYHSLQSALWYHTPLDRPLQPVQLYSAALCFVLFAALLAWLPRRTQQGEVAGVWLFIYGVGSFFLQFYRGDVSAMALFTPVQWVSLVMVVTGAALLWKHKPAAQAHTELSASA